MDKEPWTTLTKESKAKKRRLFTIEETFLISCSIKKTSLSRQTSMRYHPVRNNRIGPREDRSAHPLAFFSRRIIFLSYTDDSAFPFSPPRSFQGPRYRWAKGKWTRVFLEPRYSRDLREERKFDQARVEGVGIYLQSIFIIYLRVSSDWLLPDLCPMGRANSRAIAHGYRLPRSIKSVSKSQIFHPFSENTRFEHPFLLVRARKKFRHLQCAWKYSNINSNVS